ncbi:MAG: peptidylprolyl isomerase [Polyangiaceae bacterium UTPRO1]|jgi:FKBP-type peptidyl-prolyl cis-trans isomerase FkpA/FKBP-type peptidyl-prolyl cis-trans isomerase FklB|nr:FKBP-type peptidyl-prolyl cis-trans isomerase [Myxococcales bacterium]OQY66500.1 MAG: peptidylprolyl isomerase [Polyangiaceae bacterium UTPRO1]
MFRARTALLLCAMVACSVPAFAADPELKTDDDKGFYALGFNLSQQLTMLNLTPEEFAVVKAGFEDGALKKTPRADVKENFAKIQQKLRDRISANAAAVAAAEKKAGHEYLEKAAKENGAVKTASGMVYQEEKAGTGEQPKATDKVKVHYTGALIDGTVFDSSVQRNQPATFPLNGVIKCWTEGVQMMKVGGKAKLICPAEIAYGDQGRPPQIKPGATLVFDVELLEIMK